MSTTETTEPAEAPTRWGTRRRSTSGCGRRPGCGRPRPRGSSTRSACAPGASCLDAGCGPGETMRLLAERVGPAGPRARHGRGRRRSAPWPWRCCTARATGSAPSTPTTSPPTSRSRARRSTSCTRGCCCSTCPSASRCWPGCGTRSRPAATWSCRTTTCARSACCPTWPASTRWAGSSSARSARRGPTCTCGARLRGAVRAGRASGRPTAPTSPAASSRSAPGAHMLGSVFRSLLPVALAHGITTEDAAAATLAALERDAARFADRPMLWPLMIGAWKRKEPS